MFNLKETSTVIPDYLQKVIDFLEKINTSISIVFKENNFHFAEDKSVRDRYTVTLKRGDRSFTFIYGQSIMNSQYYQLKGAKDITFTLNGKDRTSGYETNSKKFLEESCVKKKGIPPNEYDVLTCLTLYDPETFEFFCSYHGFIIDSIKAKKLYTEVKEEWMHVCMLFSDEELELLREIQ